MTSAFKAAKKDNLVVDGLNREVRNQMDLVDNFKSKYKDAERDLLKEQTTSA